MATKKTTKKAKRKNPAAVALAKQRASSLTKKRRSEIAREAAGARWQSKRKRKKAD